MAFDATGRYLLLGGRNDGRNRPAEAARLWGLESGRFEVKGLAGAGPVAFRRDGEPLQLVAQKDHSLLLWGVHSGKALSKFSLVPASHQPSSCTLPRNELGSPLLALAQDGSVAAAVVQNGKEGRVIVWDAGSGGELFRRTRDAVALAFNRTGNLLATGDREGRITIWGVPEGKPLADFEAGRVLIHCLAFGPRGQCLAVGDSSGTLTVWDLQTCLPVTYCRGSRADIYTLAFNSDGTLLASGGRGPAQLWDAATGHLLLNLRTTGVVSTLAFAPDGRRLVVGCKGPARISVWELDAGRAIQTFRGLTTQAPHLCFSADGRLLAALSQNWQVAVWDVGRGQLRWLLALPRGNAEDATLAFSPDGGRLACSAGEEVKLWDVETARELGTWRVPGGSKDVLTFHPSGALLLFRQESGEGADTPPQTGRPRSCRLRNLLGPSPLKPLATIADFDRQLLGVVASHDGRLFIAEGIHQGANGQERSIKAYDSLTGTERWSISSTRTNLSGTLVAEPTGRLLALRTDNREDEGALVEVASGQLLGSLRPFPLSMGPGGRVIIQLGAQHQETGGRGYALFHRGDSSPRALLGIGTTTSLRPLFSPDGKSLTWSDADGSVSVCDLQQLQDHLAEVGLAW
jgi:WD40 repeat protein